MKTLHFGFTPDTDDAFHYYALESGVIPPPEGERFEFAHEHIQRLNEMSLEGRLDVTAISSVMYPRIADRYVVLSAGTSVGRGYGPALCVRAGSPVRDFEGRTVAAPGRYTTGYFLLSYFYRGFRPLFLPFDEVAQAVASGKADAGVLIHEELLNYASRGLEKIECLGERWSRETGLPLPVGLTVAKRELGAERISRIRNLLAQSMRHAMAHRDDAMGFAMGFSSGKGVTEEFVAKFANTDTESMPDDVRRGLKELYRRAYGKGLIEREPAVEII